jgi:glutathione S-transferase
MLLAARRTGRRLRAGPDTTFARRAAFRRATGRSSRTKKVPAIDLNGTVVTERAAITIFLADRFSRGRALRRPSAIPIEPPYLTMLVYNDSVLDPLHRGGALPWPRHMPATTIPSAFSRTWSPIWSGCSSERPYAAGRTVHGGRYVQTGQFHRLHHEADQDTARATSPLSSTWLRIEERPAYQRVQQKDYEMAMATPYLRS